MIKALPWVHVIMEGESILGSSRLLRFPMKFVEPLRMPFLQNTSGDCWICRKLRIWSHLLKKSFMENFIYCAVSDKPMAVALSSIAGECNLD